MASTGDDAERELCSSDSSSESSDSEIEFAPLYRIGEEGVILPYQFEPEFSDCELEDELEENEAEPTEDRLHYLAWCSCGSCVCMPQNEECVCCNEYDKIIQKNIEAEHEGCIIDHPGFAAVCLNVWALQTAYLQYRTKYGHFEGPIHERYRYTAYRQAVRFCWGFVGKNIRIVLPACLVTKIRGVFPSEEYTGFKYPNLD